MQELFIFLIRNDVWIYILCALALFWFTSEFLRANNALRRAMFGLERERSLRARNGALFFIILFGAIAGTVVFVNREIAPTIPTEVLRPPTPTPDPFALPASPTPPVPESLASPTSPIAPTVTLPSDASPTPEEENTATPPAGPVENINLPTPTVFIAGCSPTVGITDPQDGSIVTGSLSIFGSANIPGFAFYELQISGPQTEGRWASLLGRTISQRVDDGLLGTADLSPWTSGSYDVRLSVTNEDGRITNQCQITIELQTGS